jgi:serine/threonine-protein kinase RsbW
MTLPEIQLRLPARAENVALVRQAVSGIGEAMGFEPAVLADIKTAVTEACNNVVIHAYPDERKGALEVDADPAIDSITIVVRDYGGGIQPRPGDPEEQTPGLGLPLIAALSDRFDIMGGGQGIEVRMVFLLEEGAEVELTPPNGSLKASAPPPPTEDSLHSAGVAITPGPMMAPVLGRLTAMLAARSDFSLDRLSDAVLVTDAISANVPPYIVGPHAHVTFQDGKQKVDVRFGPLVDGGATELLRTLELPGLDRSLEDLAQEIKVQPGDASAGEQEDKEYLFVRLAGDAT